MKALKAYTWAILAFLWAPLVVVLYKGSSLTAFRKLLANDEILLAFRNSVLLALTAALVASLAGLATAFAIPHVPARLRRWVLDPEFFDVRGFPEIHFVSAPLAVRSLDAGGELPGWLTLRGVTRPVLFRLEPASCTLQRDTVCQIEVRGQIQRSDYGMDGHHTAVSDTVNLGLLITLDAAAH